MYIYIYICIVCDVFINSSTIKCVIIAATRRGRVLIVHCSGSRILHVHIHQFPFLHHRKENMLYKFYQKKKNITIFPLKSR